MILTHTMMKMILIDCLVFNCIFKGGECMESRKALSKKIRFEVFKRDNFTCQYCGRMAPDVVLEVDHINAVANGGDNDILNLVTSCFDCNRGKSKTKLSDKIELKRQQEQLKQLNERREQLRMMISWKKELSHLDEEQIEEFEEQFFNSTKFTLTDHGRESVKKWIHQYGFFEVINSMSISVSKYFDEYDEASLRKVFNNIPKIANGHIKQPAHERSSIRNLSIKYLK